MLVKSFLFEETNPFQQAKKVNSVKLYTGKINPSLIAQGFDSEITESDAVLDLMQDGAFIGKILEKTVLNRLKKMNYDVVSLGKNAPYDLKYVLKQADQDMDEGNIEVRVIGKTGIDISPSSTKGAQRKKDAIKTMDKIAGSKYYILVDIRKVKGSIAPSSYDVYLVLSSYLADLFKGGRLGKYGSTKNIKTIDAILQGNLTPDSIQDYEEIIKLINKELVTPQTELPRRIILKLKTKYEKELKQLQNIKTSLIPKETEPLPLPLPLVAEQFAGLEYLGKFTFHQ